jgi:predicted TPR repeat methyltransferase
MLKLEGYLSGHLIQILIRKMKTYNSRAITKFLLPMLRFMIRHYYKSHKLKLLYGMALRESSGGGGLDDQFAKDNGVLEVLSYYQKSPQIYISRDFVKSRFDKGAKDYEKLVSENSYHTGELGNLVLSVSQILKNSKHELSLLDLGCGTGLVGEQLNRYKLLVGVDLTKNMIDSCRKKNLYTELHCIDIQTYLKNTTRTFDIVYACSVVQFFTEAELRTLLNDVRNKLNKGGFFIFTFDVCDFGCRINEKLFCEHAISLCKEMAEELYQEVIFKEIDCGRIEHGNPVRCGLMILGKH